MAEEEITERIGEYSDVITGRAPNKDMFKVGIGDLLAHAMDQLIGTVSYNDSTIYPILDICVAY